MKRKVKSSIQRSRRLRLVLHQLAFDLTFVEKKEQSFTIDSLGGNNFEKGDDTLYMRISWKKPITKSDAKHCSVRITHMPTKKSEFIKFYDAKVNFESVELAPAPNRKFACRATHALEIDDEGNFISMYFTLENVQMRGDDPNVNVQVAVDYGATLFKQKFKDRFAGLKFFPADYDSSMVKIDCSQIPQRTPQWFKARGELTGSALCKLLGFYTPDPKSATEQQLQDFRDEFLGVKKVDFGGWRGVNMRFGRIKEWNIVFAYLKHFEDRKFEEVGYVPFENKPQWGASPDGILYDPKMTWEKLPKSTREEFESQKNQIDITKGAAEFKASRWDCDYKAYYFPQVIWETIALNVLWGDLVRYKEKLIYDRINRETRTEYECKSVRLYRNKRDEDRMFGLLEQALECKAKGDPDIYLELMYSEHFVNFRADMEELAQQANSMCEKIPVTEAIQEQIDQCRNSAMGFDSTLSSIDQIDQRNAAIVNGLNNRQDEQMREIIVEQIQQLSNFLK